jgi:predicted 3-demethylubiquinone-9 3-methyltransferase (glyoxalase superfamily)
MASVSTYLNFSRGEESQCGWLKDKFGLSWQIIPDILNELMSDPARSQRVMDAFLKMRKFDIEKMLNA